MNPASKLFALFAAILATIHLQNLQTFQVSNQPSRQLHAAAAPPPPPTVQSPGGAADNPAPTQAIAPPKMRDVEPQKVPSQLKEQQQRWHTPAQKGKGGKGGKGVEATAPPPVHPPTDSAAPRAPRRHRYPEALSSGGWGSNNAGDPAPEPAESPDATPAGSPYPIDIKPARLDTMTPRAAPPLPAPASPTLGEAVTSTGAVSAAPPLRKPPMDDVIHASVPSELLSLPPKTRENQLWIEHGTSNIYVYYEGRWQKGLNTADARRYFGQTWSAQLALPHSDAPATASSASAPSWSPIGDSEVSSALIHFVKLCKKEDRAKKFWIYSANTFLYDPAAAATKRWSITPTTSKTEIQSILEAAGHEHKLVPPHWFADYLRRRASYDCDFEWPPENETFSDPDPMFKDIAKQYWKIDAPSGERRVYLFQPNEPDQAKKYLRYVGDWTQEKEEDAKEDRWMVMDAHHERQIPREFP